MRKVKEIRDPLTDEIIYFKNHAGVVRMNNGMTVEDAVNLVINNHKSEDSEETIYTEDLTIVVDGITEGFIILILSEDGLVLGTQTTNLQTHKINEGVKYYIVASNVEGYIAPNSTEIFTAVKYGYREISMVYLKYLITTIRIDQNISDPATMITRIVDGGAIEMIRSNSHRYVGAFDSSSNVMSLKQLDDNDGTKYLDGSTADLTTLGNDVWMKLPQFYWKCEQYATNIWDFSVCYGEKPDNSYKEWDGKDLIGVYEAYSYLSGSPRMLYSVSGKTSIGNYSYTNFKSYTNNRGSGFSMVKWKHHCMMAMLFYTYYCNTNSQAICGYGSIYTDKTGSTDLLGMTDTVADGNGSSTLNFWGLENWWGGKNELIGDASVAYNVLTFTGTLNVTEDDGTKRVVAQNISSYTEYISTMLFGENIDMLPTGESGTSTTGFCDKGRILWTEYPGVIFRAGDRMNSNIFPQNGISYIEITFSTTDTDEYTGTRLAFRGNIVIES